MSESEWPGPVGTGWSSFANEDREVAPQWAVLHVKDLDVSLFWHQVSVLPLGMTLCDFLWSLSFLSC